MGGAAEWVVCRGSEAARHTHQNNTDKAHGSDGAQHRFTAGLFLLRILVIGSRLLRLAGLRIFDRIVRLAAHTVPFLLKAQTATSFIFGGEENLYRIALGALAHIR